MKRTLICALLPLAAASSAAAQMGPGLDLTWNTYDCGGGVSTGGGFTLTGTVGQPDAGAMSSGSVMVLGGFWGAGGPPPCYPDCNGDAALNLGDFGCFQTKFALGDPYADCNGDAVLNLGDFGCFQTKFALGCP